MTQKDYSQYSLKELYGMYTKSLNDDAKESKLIFEEITRKEKDNTSNNLTIDKKAPLFFYLLASGRNICGYLYFILCLDLFLHS